MRAYKSFVMKCVLWVYWAVIIISLVSEVT